MCISASKHRKQAQIASNRGPQSRQSQQTRQAYTARTASTPNKHSKMSSKESSTPSRAITASTGSTHSKPTKHRKHSQQARSKHSMQSSTASTAIEHSKPGFVPGSVPDFGPSGAPGTTLPEGPVSGSRGSLILNEFTLLCFDVWNSLQVAARCNV